MRRLFSLLPLSAQLYALMTSSMILVAAGALVLAAAQPTTFRLHLAFTLGAAALFSIGVACVIIHWFILHPLRSMHSDVQQVLKGDLNALSEAHLPNRDMQNLKDDFDKIVVQLHEAQELHVLAQQTLATRTSTVERLLEFAGTIQAAGAQDQVFASLAHFLRTELNLAGIAILSNDPNAVPAMQTRASWPARVLKPECPVSELNVNLCPSLRQNLPRKFRQDGSPVRCAIDGCLSLRAEHPAYCIPFNVGRSTQVVVHMLLAIGEDWSDERQNLARTYVNTAVSSLISLNLLAEAEKQSLTDALTGLYNRRSMDALLEREVALAERHKVPLSVVMIDMDHFKGINDAHGHAAGDHMLKSFADCVRLTLRKTDLAFRYGGDEFAIALPQTPVARAQQVVEKLRQSFAAVDFSDAIAHLEKQPTLSIGLAERDPENGIATMEHLLMAADQALYAAKNSTRNCVQIYASRPAA